MASRDSPENLLDLNESEFEFDPRIQRGFCKLCKINLTSAEHARQHLQGKKHIKEKNKMKTVSEMFGGSSRPTGLEQARKENKDEVTGNATGTDRFKC